MTRLGLIVAALFALLGVAACDETCRDGAQRIEASGDVFLCVKGRWERQDNPYRPPIRALSERVLG